MSLLHEVVEARVRDNLKSFEQHVLNKASGTPGLFCKGAQIYHVGRPGTSVRGFVVVASGGHLFLAGDAVCPSSGHGFTSAPGYGADWFAGKLNADYLCEKFLRKDFQPDYALDWLADAAKEAADELQAFSDEHDEDDDWCDDDENELEMRAQRLEEAVARLRARETVTADDFRAAVSRADRNLLHDGLPLAYNTDDAVNLVTLQRVFARLYDAAEGKTPNE